jgi:hypothetical protein
MTVNESTIKEVITTKRQCAFYQECYQKLGYELLSNNKSGANRTLVFQRKRQNPYGEDIEQLIEGKLRLIEITDRKKCGFRRLYLNLLIHIALFCIQAAILHTMNLQGAHPKEQYAASQHTALLGLPVDWLSAENARDISLEQDDPRP